MSTTLKKVLILVTCVIGFITLVLIFMVFMIKPPTDIPVSYSEKFENNIDSLLALFSSEQDEYSLEQTYLCFVDMFEYYKKENCINYDSQSKREIEFIDKYTPLFTRFCYGKFYSAVWDKQDMSDMKKRITELKQSLFSISKGEKTLMKDHLIETNTRELDKINGIIKDYFDAFELVKNTSYKDNELVKQCLAKASTYRKHPYLTNCTDLQNKLNKYPADLEKSHYQYVKNMIGQMNLNLCEEQDEYGQYKYNCTSLKNGIIKLTQEAMNDYSSISANYGVPSRYNSLQSEYENQHNAIRDWFHDHGDCCLCSHNNYNPINLYY